MKEAVIKIFEEGARVKVAFAKENADRIVEVVHLIALANFLGSGQSENAEKSL